MPRISTSPDAHDPVNQPVSPGVVTPIKLIRLYDAAEWETFIGEWADGFEPKYARVDTLGGPGDKGRDVIGYVTDAIASSNFDLYQCKHYDHPLYPIDILPDIGKLCAFTLRGDYKTPRSYQFVAPQGLGTEAVDLLTKHSLLRHRLKTEWLQRCEKTLGPLTKALSDYIDTFDFGVVSYVPVKAILEQHRRTPHWHHRFKRDYPDRPVPGAPPASVQATELRYVTELLGAYGQHLRVSISKAEELALHEVLRDHFLRSRIDFYTADGLNRCGVPEKSFRFGRRSRG